MWILFKNIHKDTSQRNYLYLALYILSVIVFTTVNIVLVSIPQLHCIYIFHCFHTKSFLC